MPAPNRSNDFTSPANFLSTEAPTELKNPLHRYALPIDGVHHSQTPLDLRKSIGLKHCPPLTTGEDLARAFFAMTHLKREVVVAGAVDRRMRLVSWNVVAPEPHDPRALRIADVFAPVMKTGGAGVVLIRNSAHAHARTSPHEFEFIRNVSEAAQLLGFTLLDYVVVSKKVWCSLLEKPMVEAHAPVLNLSRVKVAKAGSANWNCRRCSKSNHHAPAARPRIYGMYVTTHCSHCRSFAWLM